MISRILGEILTYSQETKTLIAVRKRNNDSSVWIGYIVEFNDSIFVLQHISSMGVEDGLIVEKIENIENFETNDGYLKTIELLYEQKNKTLDQVVRNIAITDEENWQLEMLKSGFDHSKIVTVELNNSDIVNYGYVLDYDDISLQLTIITKLGEEDGTQLFRLSDITSLTVDRIECRKRQFLHELKKRSKNSKRNK